MSKAVQPAPEPSGEPEPAEPGRLTVEIIEDRLARGAKNAAALNEQLERVFVLRETSATLKLTQ